LKLEEKEKVYECIRNDGDSFWNDLDFFDEAGETWNGYLFDDLLKILEKNGYDLVLKKL